MKGEFILLDEPEFNLAQPPQEAKERGVVFL
jgi:hypothetical protein